MINSDFIEFGEFTKDKYLSYEEPEYNLILRRMTEEPIAELEVDDFNIRVGLSGVDQINFNVYKSYMDSTGIMVDNYLYDMIEGNMIVEVNEMDYFILSKPRIISNEEDDIPYKQISGYSREYELTQKLINGYEGNSRVIYDPSNTIDENGLEIGFLNYVENNTSWRVGYVNTEVAKKYRYLNIQSNNIYKSFEDVQKAFGCLFQFDTINKIIDVYDIDQIGVNQGVYISNENYIESMEQEIEDEDIVTRLYLYGKDGISIQSLNITGQPYIEDYTYFMNEKYMSKGLIDSLLNYNKALKEKQGKFTSYVDELNDETEKQYDLEVELIDEEGKLNVLEHELDVLLSDEEKPDLTSINKKISDQEAVIEKLNKELKDVQKSIDAVRGKISDLRKDINLGDFLTKDQISEFDYFIKEERFSNMNYTEHNLEELFEEGKKVLSKISKPSLTFTVNVTDFLSIAEGRFIKDKFILGDIINLEHKDIGFNYEVKLIEYEHTPKESLLLTFSNIDSIYDDSIYLEQVLENAVNVGNTVDFSKYKWDKGEDVSNEFSEFIAHNLDLSNQALTKAKGQKPMLDDRGLWLYKENPDGTISPEQIRAINNVLAITKDNWKTTEWALTPNGIMANKLVGDMILGTDLKIISDSGIMEMLNNVLNVRDDKGRLRVSLGNYTDNKYGLKIMDKTGKKTILDEDGMLQVWQEGNVDNVDKNKGLRLNVYIPKTARYILESSLRFKPERFRAYSSTTDWDGDIYTSTEDGGYDSNVTEGGGKIYESTDWDGGVRTSTEDGGGDTFTTFGGHNYDLGLRRTLPGGSDGHTHQFDWVIGHDHRVELRPHVHRFEVGEHRHSIEVDDHTHWFEIPDHYHRIDIDSHRHDIEYGIFEDSSPYRIKVRINGMDRTNDLGGGYNGFSGNQDNLDIGKYLEIGRWNTIELTPDRLGRIDATVFIQALIGFD